MYQVGIMDNGQYPGNLKTNVTSHAHTKLGVSNLLMTSLFFVFSLLARELSESSTVLMKNDVVKSARLLPIGIPTFHHLPVSLFFPALSKFSLILLILFFMLFCFIYFSFSLAIVYSSGVFLTA
jgi:hypothetical protein